MADMTDSAYCRVVKQCCAKVIVFREMVSAEALVRGNAKTLGMAAFAPEEKPIVLQLFGADVAVMAEAARLIEEKLGPDALDINMGCPARKIVGGDGGAALMRRPQLAANIVRAVKVAVQLPVSVKTRLGWSDPAEILGFAKFIEDAGADMLTIHGRTKEQGYASRADWEMVGRAKRTVSIPVLVNGDIISGETAIQALQLSGCDGVMIGRGALGDPWVFAETAAILSGGVFQPPDIAERLAVIRRHAAWHAAESGGDKPLVTFRKHLAYYAKGLPGTKTLRQKLVQVSTLADLDGILEDIEAPRK